MIGKLRSAVHWDLQSLSMDPGIEMHFNAGTPEDVRVLKARLVLLNANRLIFRFSFFIPRLNSATTDESLFRRDDHIVDEPLPARARGA
jgi:hypothetical protein